MISIHHPRLAFFAERHYLAIEQSLKNANHNNRLHEQNKRVRRVFGADYDFKKIILASPEEIERLVKKWNKSKEDKKGFDYYKGVYKGKFSNNKLVFNKNGTDEVYGALVLIDDLELKVCPYCNRNFINNTNKKGNRTCDIDHFYPKQEFPFLAISFFNLIPSCKFCNFIKKDDWNTQPNNQLINPYDRRFSFDMEFIVKFKNSRFYYDDEGIDLELKSTESRRLQNHIKAFHLDTLYQSHKGHVLELIQKKYMYSESYIDSLFKQYEGTLFKNREDLLRLIADGYVDENELMTRPLSKLTRDIIHQLDL